MAIYCGDGTANDGRGGNGDPCTSGGRPSARRRRRAAASPCTAMGEHVPGCCADGAELDGTPLFFPVDGGHLHARAPSASAPRSARRTRWPGKTARRAEAQLPLHDRGRATGSSTTRADRDARLHRRRRRLGVRQRQARRRSRRLRTPADGSVTLDARDRQRRSASDGNVYEVARLPRRAQDRGLVVQAHADRLQHRPQRVHADLRRRHRHRRRGVRRRQRTTAATASAPRLRARPALRRRHRAGRARTATTA